MKLFIVFLSTVEWLDILAIRCNLYFLKKVKGFPLLSGLGFEIYRIFVLIIHVIARYEAIT
jgi:hypothetical protein